MVLWVLVFIVVNYGRLYYFLSMSRTYYFLWKPRELFFLFNKLISMFIFLSCWIYLTATSCRSTILANRKIHYITVCLALIHYWYCARFFFFFWTLDLNSETTKQLVPLVNVHRSAGFQSFTGRVGCLIQYFRIGTMLYFFFSQNDHPLACRVTGGWSQRYTR